MDNPRLTDFGFSSITINDFSTNASIPNRRGSTRWRAPELLVLSTRVKDKGKAKAARPTNKSDACSLAIAVIEVKFSPLAQSPVSQSSKYLQIYTKRHPFDFHSDDRGILLLVKDLRPGCGPSRKSAGTREHRNTGTSWHPRGSGGTWIKARCVPIRSCIVSYTRSVQERIGISHFRLL